MDINAIKDLVVEISVMKVKDLKGRCKEKGIKIPARAKKLDLIKLVVDLELLEMQVEDVAESDYAIDPKFDKHLESKIEVSKRRDAIEAEIEQLEVELAGFDIELVGNSREDENKFYRLEDLKEELEIYNCSFLELISKYEKLVEERNEFENNVTANFALKFKEIRILQKEKIALEQEKYTLEAQLGKILKEYMDSEGWKNTGNFDNKKFDILYKKLALFLHPDKSTGDLGLMQELNNFRDGLKA